MHHTVAWRASIADATETDLTPVPDTLVTIQNSHFIFQQDQFIQYACFSGLTVDRARIITPSLRQISPVWIRPIQGTIVPGDEPNVADYRRNPLRIRGLEEVQINATQTTGGAAVNVVTAGFSRQPLIPAAAGDIYVMRGTATTTLTAGAWTLGTITWADILPAGSYQCVGLEYFGTTALAARLIFEDQWERPGCVGVGADINAGHPMFQVGNLGVWGRFTGNRMPSVEFLGNAADTAEEVYLHFQKVG